MATDLDTYRDESLETWDEMAPAWEERREWFMGVTGKVNDWLVEKAAPQPGETVLDVAAGTGDLGFLAAERVGGEGRVISTDFSPEMVEVARRNGESRGLGNVDYRVLDAERMQLEDGSVDRVVCRWGYMLMADPAAALGETRRVLREGQPLAFAVWRTPDLNPWGAVPAMTLVERGHMPPPEPGMPGIYAMGDPELVKERVTGAGFREPELESIEFDFRFSDYDDIWDLLSRFAGPIARVIAALDEDERAATREAIREKLEPYRQGDGSYVEPAATWGVLTR